MSAPKTRSRLRNTVLPMAIPVTLLALWVAVLQVRSDRNMLASAAASQWVSQPAVSPTIVANPLRVAFVHPSKGFQADETPAASMPLFDWLAGQIGAQAVVVPTADDSETASQLATGRIDLAVLSAEGYVRAKRQDAGLDLLAGEVRWNDNRTKLVDSSNVSIIVLKSHADLTDIRTLSGKAIGFLNADSTIGYRYPRAFLKTEGIECAPSVKQTRFFTTDDRLVDALVSGDVDAVAVTDFTLEQARQRNGDLFKVLLKSPPIPNVCVVAHPNVPAKTREKLRAMLLHINPALLEGGSARGYVSRPDSFYDVARTLVMSEEESSH